MICISVCIGSACHLKGSYLVICTLQELIARHQLEDKVEIKAVFCLQTCGKAVSVKINDEPVQYVSVEDVQAFFKEQVLTKL